MKKSQGKQKPVMKKRVKRKEEKTRTVTKKKVIKPRKKKEVKKKMVIKRKKEEEPTEGPDLLKQILGKGKEEEPTEEKTSMSELLGKLKLKGVEEPKPKEAPAPSKNYDAEFKKIMDEFKGVTELFQSLKALGESIENDVKRMAIQVTKLARPTAQETPAPPVASPKKEAGKDAEACKRDVAMAARELKVDPRDEKSIISLIEQVITIKNYDCTAEEVFELLK